MKILNMLSESDQEMEKVEEEDMAQKMYEHFQ